jgi:hypothetical protein
MCPRPNNRVVPARTYCEQRVQSREERHDMAGAAGANAA